MTGSSSAVGMLRRLSLCRSASTEMSLRGMCFTFLCRRWVRLRARRLGIGGPQSRRQRVDDVERLPQLVLIWHRRRFVGWVAIDEGPIAPILSSVRQPLDFGET